ncbi:MAG: hypothetical protein QN160_10100 [Armatimonadota bacterium]|nr:hypothetical protein [Armatimonadota bacterium]
MMSLVMSGLFGIAILEDLRRREVSVPVLLALGLPALIGRPWPWWVAAAVAFLVPRREWALYAVPFPVAAGILAGEAPPAVAMVAGLLAWAFRWWGGADGILLSVLALRYGMEGLWAGTLALAAGGAATLLLRRRSPIGVLGAALDLLSGRAVAEEEIPKASEIPAAAFLGAAGIALELIALWRG